MDCFKYYVDVVTYIDKKGILTPMAVIWQNRKYKVDKVVSIRETYSEAGGCGICYECRMGSQTRKLFWERNRWFLESQVFFPGLKEE